MTYEEQLERMASAGTITISQADRLKESLIKSPYPKKDKRNFPIGILISAILFMSSPTK